MSRAVLIPNITTFPSESMRRYAAELEAALRPVAGPTWEIDALRCEPVRGLGESWGSRAARFGSYPVQIGRTPGDVFHVLDHSHANLALASPAARTVLTCHDIIPLLAAKGILEMPTGRLTRYTFPLRLACMRRCRFVIAISESTKRDLITHGGLRAEQVQVVYYGVNPRFTPTPPNGLSRADERVALLAKYQIPTTAKVLLHVGTATRYKNTPALLHALRALREEKSLADAVYLLRVGAEFFPDEAQLIEELGIANRIVHAGKIFDDALLGAHYRAADLFVFPSLHEGFGWPPLEAMASGTAVVTSNVASLPEVVGDAGVTLSPTDHAGLVGALVGLLTNDDRRQAVAERCYARSQRFTWEQCARGTLAVYEQILKRG